jgi:glycosyltransferase involved in cell wall biosynthesis
MDKNIPLVSIIIPCRNEEKFIDKCLHSIISNDYSKDNIELLVVDGMSEDNTRAIVKEYVKKYQYIKLIDNPDKIAPCALNIGIKNAKGEIIMRMDAHTHYEHGYIGKCIKSLQEYNADNVGGVCITLPSDVTLVSQSIALALSHRFGVGNVYFRIGSKEPRHVDTVPFGCYRRGVFDEIGLFNENLVRNQDLELNLRLKRAGGNILLVPDLVSYYHARSNFKDLFKQNFWNGFWVIYGSKFAKIPFSLRHLVPLFFVLSLAGSLLLSLLYNPFIYLFVFMMGLYVTVNLFFSLRLSFKHNIKYLPFLIISFFTLHFSYGAGSLWGGIRLLSARVLHAG